MNTTVVDGASLCPNGWQAGCLSNLVNAGASNVIGYMKEATPYILGLFAFVIAVLFIIGAVRKFVFGG